MQNMLNKILNIIKLVCISWLLLPNQSSSQNYKYSQILSVPDLSFHPAVFTGLDILEQLDFAPLHNKTIGIFCNQTAVNQNGRHLLSLLKDHPEINVSIIFAPQYGLFATNDGRLKIKGEGDVDPIHGARIMQLFGRRIQPPDWALENLDLILIDVQDTGVRYTTFAATMTKIMEAANKLSIPIMVLDRPNPLRGDRIDGPVMRTEYQSFEGYHLVPIRHGLTMGEYALMINEMGWIKDLKRVDLTIIPLANWQRNKWYLNQSRINPAPDLNNLKTNLAFSGFGLLSGTNLNDGAGTDKHYFRAGAPWLSGAHLAEKLLKYKLPGLKLKVVQYIPRAEKGQVVIPLYVDQLCSGIEIEITNIDTFDPLATATALIILTSQLYPREFEWIEYDRMDKLYGYNQLRTFAAQNKPANYLPPLWFHDVIRFNEFRQKFLIY